MPHISERTRVTIGLRIIYILAIVMLVNARSQVESIWAEFDSHREAFRSELRLGTCLYEKGRFPWQHGVVPRKIGQRISEQRHEADGKRAK
jgi:hypothetical protein